MAVERMCKNCAHLRKKRGKLYCPIVKQSTAEKNICRNFKAK
jgi:hypothetical protein